MSSPLADHVMPATGGLTRLALLGLLWGGPKHGYDLQQNLVRRGYDRWANIRPGSIYAALRRLADRGHVEIEGVSREGNMPERTTYRLTEAGRAELCQGLREALSVPRYLASESDIAFTFVNLLPAEEVAELFAHRLDALNAQLEAVDAVEPAAPNPGVHAIVEDLLHHSRLHLQAEIDWTTRVRDRVLTHVYDHEES